MRGYLKIMEQFPYYPWKWKSEARLKHILIHYYLTNIFSPIQRVRTGSSQVGQTFNWSKGFGLLGPFKPAHSNQFKDPKPLIRSSGLDPDPPIWQSYPSTRPIRSYFGSNP
jgi:hypothetical protein